MGKCHFYKPVKNLKYLMKDQKFITASIRDSLVRILSQIGAVYIFSTFSSRSILILFPHACRKPSHSPVLMVLYYVVSNAYNKSPAYAIFSISGYVLSYVQIFSTLLFEHVQLV